jgi:hypothetical protein
MGGEVLQAVKRGGRTRPATMPQGSRSPKPEADFLATTLDEDRHIHRCHLEPRLA